MYSPFKSKLYARFFFITGFQISPPYQIRNKILFFTRVFIKTHLFFRFIFFAFTSHLTKIFSWVG